MSDKYRPAAQPVHSAVPGAAAKDPTAQLAQAPAPVAEKLPVGHARHAAEDTEPVVPEKLPAGQPSQLDDAARPGTAE